MSRDMCEFINEPGTKLAFINTKNLCFALKFDADQIICKVARYDVKRLI